MIYRKYNNGKLDKLTKLGRNALLSSVDNPSALFTHKEVMVINPENATFTAEQTKEIKTEINNLLKQIHNDN